MIVSLERQLSGKQNTRWEVEGSAGANLRHLWLRDWQGSKPAGHRNRGRGRRVRDGDNDGDRGLWHRHLAGIGPQG